MVKMVSLKNCTVLKMLCAFQVRKAENNRGYVDFDGIRLVYDFDALDIVGWYNPSYGHKMSSEKDAKAQYEADIRADGSVLIRPRM